MGASLMGKRSDFPRIEKDAYMTTDPRAVRPLFAYLASTIEHYDSLLFDYYEPCAGDGSLISLLSGGGYTCVGSSDDDLDARTTQYSTHLLMVYYQSSMDS